MKAIYPHCHVCHRLLKEIPLTEHECTRLRTCKGCGSRVQVDIRGTSWICSSPDTDTDRAAELHAEGHR